MCCCFAAKTPLTKRPAPVTPFNANKKSRNTSAHLFIVDGPNTIKEMGLDRCAKVYYFLGFFH